MTSKDDVLRPRSEASAEAQGREKLARSHKRGRAILVLLGVLVPILVYALLERQARRLDALADHGHSTNAVVTAIKHQGSVTYVTYEYLAGTTIYTWSVTRKDAPYGLGESFVVSYLPESPSLSRPGVERSRAAEEATSNRGWMRNLMLGLVVFFAFNLALLELKIRRLREGKALVIHPKWAGRIIALLMLGSILTTNFFDDVQDVQRKGLGAAPLGVPVAIFVSVAEMILLAPYLWVFEHVMTIVLQAFRDGTSLTKGGLAWYILRVHKLHPELARSRKIALAGLAYFIILAGSWIIYAEHRGL